MNWQEEAACFYTCSLRYLHKNGIQSDPNFLKNVWLERHTFALLKDM